MRAGGGGGGGGVEDKSTFVIGVAPDFFAGGVGADRDSIQDLL